MSGATVRTRPAVVDIPEAAAMLGIGRTLAYRLGARGRLADAVIRMGRLIKVPLQPLQEYLASPLTRRPKRIARLCPCLRSKPCRLHLARPRLTACGHPDGCLPLPWVGRGRYALPQNSSETLLFDSCPATGDRSGRLGVEADQDLHHRHRREAPMDEPLTVTAMTSIARDRRRPRQPRSASWRALSWCVGRVEGDVDVLESLVALGGGLPGVGAAAAAGEHDIVGERGQQRAWV